MIKTITLTVLLILGPNGLKPNEAAQVIEATTERFREVGVDIRVKRLRVLKDIRPDLHTIDTRTKRRNFWTRYVYKRHINNDGPVYIMLPPVWEHPHDYYLSGGAEDTCTPYGVAAGNAERFNELHQPRLADSTEIMAHNVAHLLGASDSDYGIMNTDMMLGFHGMLPQFDATNKAEFKGCLE
jgi:hypothetical protein